MAKRKSPREKLISQNSDDVIDSFSGTVRASRMLDYSDIGGVNISGRPGMSHRDYEAHRPNERTIFNSIKDEILEAERVYKRHGLVRNIIDIMADFAAQGVRLVHPNKKVQRFYQNWFKKINGEERCERFLNTLYKLGNVVIDIQTARLNLKYRKLMFSANAADIEPTATKVAKYEIPWKYTFLHPATVDVVGGALSSFVSDPQYAVTLPSNIKRTILHPKTAEEKRIVDKLPDEIINAAKNNGPILLPKGKTRVYHYKKEDWNSWASPMVASAFVAISLYEKLQLADRSALDGAINNIRIIKLGNIEHKIKPEPAAFDKLNDILQSNTACGTLDLVWDAAIEIEESQNNVDKFLGEEKYRPTLMDIYATFGIPPTLTGSFGASGTTNNYISLKTLTQRLEYGRSVLTQFLDEQIKIVQLAMGFKEPAKVEFDYTNLGDEAAEKALLIQMSDRNLISDELLQRYFGHDAEMETVRINNEAKERENGNRQPKSGSFYDPQFEEQLKKLALQTGLISTKEAGLEDVPNRKVPLEDKTAQTPTKKPSSKKSGQYFSGRPKNAKDSKKRKTKEFKPKVRATINAWANQAQAQIHSKLAPIFLAKHKKKNLRELSAVQAEELEILKFSVLCSIEPQVVIDEQTIYQALEQKTEGYVWSTYEDWNKELAKALGRPITLEERKVLQSSIYVLNMEKKHGESNNNS